MAKIKRQGDKSIQACVKLKLKVEKFSINTAARGRGGGFRSIQSRSRPALQLKPLPEKSLLYPVAPHILPILPVDAVCIFYNILHTAHFLS